MRVVDKRLRGANLYTFNPVRVHSVNSNFGLKKTNEKHSERVKTKLTLYVCVYTSFDRVQERDMLRDAPKDSG